VNGEGRRKPRRSYLPVVEALEALRLLSQNGSLAPLLTSLPAEFDIVAGPQIATPQPLPTTDTWDSALVQTQVADLLGPGQSPTDTQQLGSGLSQLDRYLSRAWYRAGIPPQQHDDCTQAVYLTLLQNLGRAPFDHLLADVGRLGVRDVLSRETAEGPDFFRAIDTIKKRAQRERSFQPLDENADLASPRDSATASDWRSTLQEAIDQSLSPREAALIYATLKGETPLEIASQWGVAPKTVSNEKTRVIQKLRDFLVTDMPD
jgi:RNA polymerase sigma factor (sigma-70 family)